MRVLLTFLTICLSFQLSIAGDLTFSDSKPQTNSTVKVSYNSDSDFNGSVYLVSYHFKTDKKYPTAQSITINNSVDLKINSDDNFIIFKVINENGVIDDNNGRMWDLVIYNGEKPQKEGFLNRALSYLGATGENYSRVPNYEKIDNALDSELVNYPNSIRAQIAKETLKLDFKLTKFDDFNEKLRAILNTKVNMDDELAVMSVIKALYSINEKEKAEGLEKDFINKNSKSDLAKENKLEKLSEVGSFEEFISKISDYLNDNYKDKDISTVYNSFVFAHSQSKVYMDKLDNSLNKLSRKPAYIYNEIALTYLEDEDLKKEYTTTEQSNKAMYYIDLGFKAIPEFINFKPIDISDFEWQTFTAKTESDLYLTQYKTNLLKSDSGAAFNSVMQAIKKAPNQMNSLLYTEVLDLAVKHGSVAQIKEIITFAYESNSTDSELEKTILKVITEKDEINISFLNNLIELKQKENIKKLKNSLVDDIQLTGFVQKLDNTFFDLESMKGSIKIISIGSSWCDVCTQVYPVINQLKAKYDENSKVNVIGISIWEDDDAIKNTTSMIKEYEIKYPYYIDNTDILPRKLNVFGFPTILIVDQNNKVRYTIRGFNNGEELIKLVDDFVEILK